MILQIKDILNEVMLESSLSRISDTINNFDIAIISAWRDQNINCINYDEISPEGYSFSLTKKVNRNKELLATLLKLGYGATKLGGTYFENWKTKLQKEVKERSFFVVNLKDDKNFINNIIKIGKHFCQDSVFLKQKGEKPYLYGTNYNAFPGLDEKETGFENKLFLGKDDAQFISKVKGRPFYFTEIKNEKEINVGWALQTFENSQARTKSLIDKYSNLKIL